MMNQLNNDFKSTYRLDVVRIHGMPLFLVPLPRHDVPAAVPRYSAAGMAGVVALAAQVLMSAASSRGGCA
ncbi:unnamed protein product [Anisakis simplex]|uniref:Transcriptional regulator n=1 Tax=Anisakis simplex TaxID=6269 RepID=A0A0M3JK36_ANISI|nr:unnamed protein product [Anisakis simplex]